MHGTMNIKKNSLYFLNIKTAHRIVPINKLYDASALSQTFAVSNA